MVAHSSVFVHNERPGKLEDDIHMKGETMRITKSGLFAVLALCVVGIVSVVPAAVKLPAVFNNDMVLQREMPVPVWGFADAGEEVTVKFAGQTKTAKTAADGKWTIKLDEMKACAKPMEMTVTGSAGKALTLKNVLVGEVWLGSGQSNMEMSVGGCLDVCIPYVH